MKNSADQRRVLSTEVEGWGGITPSKICRILHILRKPNSKIALLFIQNISPLKGVLPLHSLFFHSPNITQPCTPVFSVNSSIICSGLHFWRHFDIIGSITFVGLHFWRHWFNMTKIFSKFGEQQLVMVNYACGFNQSEMGKYFEWIIIIIIGYLSLPTLQTVVGGEVGAERPWERARDACWKNWIAPLKGTKIWACLAQASLFWPLEENNFIKADRQAWTTMI